MRTDSRATHAYAIAAVGGALLWIATMAATGRSEAWDSPHYWQITYPLCIVLAAILGYVQPERPWRWALTVMWIQALAMMLTSGSSWSLLPLGLIMFAVLAVPLIIAGGIAARVRRRLEAR
jgi:peptidoglycan/LPS O-acetylase OafA/YrhL